MRSVASAARMVRPVPRKARLIAHRRTPTPRKLRRRLALPTLELHRRKLTPMRRNTRHPVRRCSFQPRRPSGGTYQIDDVWIFDTQSAAWGIYLWNGTDWVLTYTDPGLLDSEVATAIKAFAIIGNETQAGGDVTGVYLVAAGGALPDATAARYNANAVTELDGVWYRIQLTGHGTATNNWTWADLNDGHNDLSQFRGIVAENPFSIPNPQVLDWAYLSE